MHATEAPIRATATDVATAAPAGSDPRLVALLERSGAEVLVSADPGTVKLLTGHHGDVETGPSPFLHPPVVVATATDAPLLICAEDEREWAPHVRHLPPAAGVELDPVGRHELAVVAALAELRVLGRRTIVDHVALDTALQHRLERVVPAVGLGALRAVKTPAEQAGVAAAVRLADAGQHAARQASWDGHDELDVWIAARTAIEREAGGRVPLLADVLSGRRTETVSGAPRARRLSDPDPVLVDLAPRLHGFWADSCATWAVGEPTDALRDAHAVCEEALHAALEATRAGALAGDVDAAARAAAARHGAEYAHHTGHGVGFAYHEEPRLVPGATRVLEAGMVVAIEPGCYRRGVGARLEVVAVVGEDGAEVLSGHELALDDPPRSGA
ncbi:M24 family metallopeptidase [Conexibacter woesei]|uniref:Peptidase M24 n=1 Tax=Conexibacter woesei (strain DSM 14684 / CCUG 47730 / CIP 108061 / JCM 11494 / NBRC 100937 / ID131577) TaxID=469383 RepID=D3F758_CONWI|nr:Xaa-Pro peptidase family protein [Conexibacter woesei]ADB48829.1 peptidase M24 [Conexibacter woesei DSM 14684]